MTWLARGTNSHVYSYTGYAINGYTFYTKEQDDKSTMQNSGVTLVDESMHISSVEETNLAYTNLSYFGVINCIWELDYTMFRVPAFGCMWVDNKNGVRNDEPGFLKVDLNRVGYEDEPFILASQAKQVFYVTDPANVKWSMVLLSNKVGDDNNRNHNDEDVEDDPFLPKPRSPETGPTIDDDLYVRDDHAEGIFVDPSFHVVKPKKKRIAAKKRKRSKNA